MDLIDYQAGLSAEFNKRFPILEVIVAFIFDEAGILLDSNKNTHAKESNFVSLRRAFTHFPRRIGYLSPLALMVDTTGKISNFAPSRSVASTRATQMPRGIFPTFYLLANVDIWATKHDPANSLAALEDWKYYCQFGRPYWGALAKQIISQTGAVSIIDVMDLARVKLLGGKAQFKDEGEPSIGEAMAVLGVRVCVDVVPQCLLSDVLVAQHMRTLNFVSDDRERMITGYFSEPVLVQAAAQLSNESTRSGANRWGVLLKVLIGSLRNGMVDAGFRGELVARILLLMAWDKCCIATLRDGEALMSSGVFLRAVPLLDFLKTLLNLDADALSYLKESFDGSDGVAWVRCSHFVKIDYVPNAAQLFELYTRGAAAVTKELQPGVDLVIPLLFAKGYGSSIDESMVSCVLLQIKNRKNRDNSYPNSATASLTDKAAGIKLGNHFAFLSLYMSFCPYISRDKKHIVMPSARVRPSERVASKRQAQPSRQVSLAVFTLTAAAYKVLDESSAQLLQIIGRNWIDPVELHRGNADFRRMV